MDDIHAQAKSGIKALMVRQVFLQIFTFGGGVILARVLGPAQFGLFAIASFWVGIFAILGDFGLAPSFIQRQAELTEHDLQIGFTLQQIITTIIVAALFVVSPLLGALYPKAPTEIIWLVRALAFSLYLTSWRAVSALQLERRLRYKRLAWIEVVESVSYQTIAVGLVLAGYGIWSLFWAVLTRSLLGTILVYLAAPWRVGFRFDRGVAKGILRYGLPFQLQEITNHSSDWVIPVLAAARIGPQAVGLLTWASSNGKKPLILVDNVMRVAFPHFSRIQDDRAEVERTLTRYLTYLLIPSGVWLAELLTAGPSLVVWIYSDKWIAGIPALMLYGAALCFEVINAAVAVTLNSLGLVRITTRAILLRSLTLMGFSIFFMFLIGYNGIPLAYLVAYALTVPFLYAGLGDGALRRIVTPIIWILIPIVVSTVVGLAVVQIPLLAGPRSLITTIAVCLVYLSITLIAGPNWLASSFWVRCSPFMPVRISNIVRATK